MEAFNHISGNIDKIYKQLTKSNTHPLGGTAYLNLDNEDEPFLHGIKFTAMPPTKRFRDMEQLSGGEKTVAALALLFSIHRFDLKCIICLLALWNAPYRISYYYFSCSYQMQILLPVNFLSTDGGLSNSVTTVLY